MSDCPSIILDFDRQRGGDNGRQQRRDGYAVPALHWPTEADSATSAVHMVFLLNRQEVKDGVPNRQGLPVDV